MRLPPRAQAEGRRDAKAGAKGIKIQLSGRIGGAEIARVEKMINGSIPAAHAAGEHQLRPGSLPHDLRHDRRQGVDLPRHVCGNGRAGSRRPAATGRVVRVVGKHKDLAGGLSLPLAQEFSMAMMPQE